MNNLDEETLASLDATAILQCLQFLAQEAACLNLPETLSAIEEALETATREGGAGAGRRGMAQAQAFLH